MNAIQRLIDPNFRAELGNDARRRRKRDGRAFDRRGRRGKNRFTDNENMLIINDMITLTENKNIKKIIFWLSTHNNFHHKKLFSAIP